MKSKEVRRFKDEEGRELIEYENGGIKNIKGQFVQPPADAGIKSSEQASLMGRTSQLKRKEKQREQIRAEILRVTNDAAIATIPAATLETIVVFEYSYPMSKGQYIVFSVFQNSGGELDAKMGLLAFAID